MDLQSSGSSAPSGQVTVVFTLTNPTSAPYVGHASTSTPAAPGDLAMTGLPALALADLGLLLALAGAVVVTLVKKGRPAGGWGAGS